jgi:predicted nucleic acid-binding protein
VTAIFDASVIFPLLVEEENSEACQELVEGSPDRVHLDFTIIEVSNSLRSAVLRNRISSQRAAVAFQELKIICENPIQASDYLDEAFALALKINHSVNDCLYAIAARQNDATLVTCDAKFSAKLDPAIYRVLVL